MNVDVDICISEVQEEIPQVLEGEWEIFRVLRDSSSSLFRMSLAQDIWRHC